MGVLGPGIEPGISVCLATVGRTTIELRLTPKSEFQVPIWIWVAPTLFIRIWLLKKKK